MIKSVIFDIGKVMIDFDWEGHLAKYFDEETANAVNLATWKNPSWNEFDRGVMTFDEVVSLFEKEYPAHAKEIRFAMERIGECPNKMPYAVPWVKELKNLGYNVYYLSNYFEHLMKARPDILDFIEFTDGGVFSCNEKITKPDERIYRIICERYSLVPDECLFIDDSEKNIVAAEKFGIHGMLFEGYEKTYPKVMKILSENK